METIGKEAFNSCYRLYYIDFDQNSELKTIESRTFNSTPIQKISIPNNVTCISDYAFHGCQSHQIIDIKFNSKIQTNGKSFELNSNLQVFHFFFFHHASLKSVMGGVQIRI